eukprot:CAMPEP_0197652130 /NCGR_PEP_ID=MMETSP1338-20131121/34257_1 /TAXON_ID=43686 ORGANISM="Pelagodinium beii, Strain RCC1491" /NCGR_SAMPLE_ID=MMETSP1338 /ASSEMBLY_ACC=CAM_ASM_000754 /LENGTH=323 /DNA_ID=CAMNT_0043226931 /DNA_START=48 /DNA_END=1016 /DNA_ORIENTATION=-
MLPLFAAGVLTATFQIQKQFNLTSDPTAEWDIGEYTDAHLTHSCANYVNDGSTVSTRDGKLVLSVSSACEDGGCLNSARIMSKDSFKYGLYVFKAQVPKCNYVWPAIWLLPEDKDGTGAYGGWPCSGEIDVLETVDDHNFGTFNLVAGYGSDGGCSSHEFTCNRCRPGFCVSSSLQNSSSGAYFVEDVDCSSGTKSWHEHTWVMHWQPDKLTTWLDPSLEKDDQGQIISVTPKNADTATSGFPSWKTYDRETTASWSAVGEFMDQCYPELSEASAPFDAGFKLVLNIAIGGYEGAGCKWGENCSTNCAGAVGSELIMSEISVW